MRDGIRLSDKHGVNPSMGVCILCGEDDGTIGLLGRLPDDAEAPRRAILTAEPCPKCEEHMKQGVIFIGVKNGADGKGDPYALKSRTGHFFVLKDEAVSRVFDAAAAVPALEKRVAFIDEETMERIGLTAATTTPNEGEPA